MHNGKTKEQLTADVAALQRRVAELEDAADQHEETRDALRRRNRELSLFNRVGRTLSSTLDLDAVLVTLLEEVRSLLDIIASSVWLVEPETGALVCKHATGPRNGDVRGWRLPPGEGFVGLVAQTGESLIVPDTQEDARYFSGVAEEADLVLRSIMTIPLQVGDRVVGVLQAVDTEVDRFDVYDLALLRPLAAEAAIAVENARLYQAAQQEIAERKRAEAQVIREAERAAALLRIASRLNSYLTLEELLGAICEETGRALDLPGAMVFMHKPAQGVFTLAQSSGVSAAVEVAFRPPPDDVCHRLGHDDRVLIPDFRDDPALVDHELTVRYGIRTLVGMRIVYEEELLGCLMVHTVDKPRTFSADDLALLRGIADHAANAIVIARLFSEQRRSRRRLEALSQRLVEAQEVERRYLARELHDDIGQVLTSIKLSLQAIQGRGLEPESMETLEISLHAVDGAIQRVRRLSRDLRPSVLDDLGLVPALRSLVDRDAQHAPFEASFAADPLEARLPAPLESAYFRITQEALTNAMRHADATHVFVELRLREGDLVLIVRDDGCGFDIEGAVDEAEAGQSLGLVSMQERVHLIGGTFEVRSEPGSGTEIRVRAPIDAPGLHGVDDPVPNWIPQ